MWSKATSGVDALMLQNIALIKDKLEYTYDFIEFPLFGRYNFSPVRFPLLSLALFPDFNFLLDHLGRRRTMARQ